MKTAKKVTLYYFSGLQIWQSIIIISVLIVSMSSSNCLHVLMQNDLHVDKKLSAMLTADIIDLLSKNLCEYIPIFLNYLLILSCMYRVVLQAFNGMASF